MKVINERNGGWVFHYAHFLCDLVLPEVVNRIYEHPVCYREHSELQTIGNFSPLWESIMNTKNVELSEEEFKSNPSPPKIMTRFKNKINVYGKREFDIFRNYMFKRFNIQPDPTYPKIILIERGVNKNLINDEMKQKLKNSDKSLFSTGKERREIKDIHLLKEHLKNIPNYKCIMLEHMSMEEQIKHFYNANIIIAAHGAGLSNMLFCNKNTTIIEVVCEKWQFFDIITNELELNHIKCENSLPSIIKTFNSIYKHNRVFKMLFL